MQWKTKARLAAATFLTGAFLGANPALIGAGSVEVPARNEAAADAARLDVAEEESLVRQLSSETRSLLQKWFTSCLKGSPDRGREPEVFAAPFAAAGPGALVASFPNLGGDATLIAPCPDAAAGPYPHLAAFCRRAPKRQLLAFWKAVGEALADSLSARPLWLSTSGLGVAWLHARLDSTPKYYTHAPYRSLG